jgi:hypothetical protein
MTQVTKPIPPSRILFDLPSYCYDMHTTVCLQVLQRLVRGVTGAEGIKDFFRMFGKKATRAIVVHTTISIP